MSTRPTDDLEKDFPTTEDIQRKLDEIEVRSGKKDRLLEALRNFLLKDIERVGLQVSKEQSVPISNPGFTADKLQLGPEMELHVFPSMAGRTNKVSEEKKPSPPSKDAKEEAPEEMVLSHFDFDQIDPRKNCLLEKENLKLVSLKEMAEKRHLAARSIAALVNKIPFEKITDSQLRNLERLRFSSKLQPLQVILQDSWFLEGEFRALPTDIDLYTAGIFILMLALKENIIIPDKDNPYYLRIKEGEKLICYRRVPISGSQNQWETIPFELPSFRDLKKSY
jgi:hypothetical protein